MVGGWSYARFDLWGLLLECEFFPAWLVVAMGWVEQRLISHTRCLRWKLLSSEY